MEVAVLTDDCDIFCFVELATAKEAAILQYHPKEERGNIRMCKKGEGGGSCIYGYLRRFVSGLVRITSSHEEQTSLTSAFLGRRKCNNWAHKIFS